jgi:hypothetical protein
MIRTPDFVAKEELEAARAALRKRGKAPEATEVHLETFTEGACVQMLHVGPYEQEGLTAEKMAAFAKTQGMAAHGRHPDIYISDPRRVPPERLKTILRQQVK